jgi:hypothetical protein
MFDTSKVVFYDYTSYSKKEQNIAFPAVNNPDVSKIDTNFLPGIFSDIKIDFDPLPDPSYDYNGDISFFLQSDMTIVKSGNGNYVASMPLSGNFVGYRNWTPSTLPSEQDRNEELEVYVDNISYFTHMFEPVFNSRTNRSPDFYKPSTTIEISSRYGGTKTYIVQITDSYIHKDSVIFNLNNEIVKMYDESGALVNSYNSLSKIVDEGQFTQVRMDIDSAGCGYLGYTYWLWTGMEGLDALSADLNGGAGGCGQPQGCANQQGCHYKWNWACCTTYGSCPDSCNCLCNQALRACGANSCFGWMLWLLALLGLGSGGE